MNDQGLTSGANPSDRAFEQAVSDATELMRLVLRAVSAMEPTRTLERLAEHLLHYAPPPRITTYRSNASCWPPSLGCATLTRRSKATALSCSPPSRPSAT
jgi:hypothetical protein